MMPSMGVVSSQVQIVGFYLDWRAAHTTEAGVLTGEKEDVPMVQHYSYINGTPPRTHHFIRKTSTKTTTWYTLRYDIMCSTAAYIGSSHYCFACLRFVSWLHLPAWQWPPLN